MPKLPALPTGPSVQALASWYVDRYAPTEAKLRAWLGRRVAAMVAHHGTDPAEARGFVEAAVSRMLSLGTLDDRRWAESKARALRRRGTSTRAVRARSRGRRRSGRRSPPSRAECG